MSVLDFEKPIVELEKKISELTRKLHEIEMGKINLQKEIDALKAKAPAAPETVSQ